jgi:hypothetical protein
MEAQTMPLPAFDPFAETDRGTELASPRTLCTVLLETGLGGLPKGMDVA